MSNPIVETSQGKLQGLLSESDSGTKFYTFKSIPYAKPPINELRFSPPLPPDSWEGVRDATKDCNICAQFDKETMNVVGDEDCLYLNVYTPKLPTDGVALPVMVFFHGGGFVFGSGTDDSIHGADYLVEKDVVVVSLNYRLGILGFLCLGTKDAPGNMGLKDQVQALKWINQNIKSFGGDPGNITIFGISAGGASVEYLMLSPMAKGLFHKAIAQSGSSLLHWAQTTNQKVKDLAQMIPILKKKVINNSKELLEYLKGMPLNELISNSMIVLALDKWRGGIHFGFVPTIEEDGDWEPFITKSTYNLLAQGEFNKVPYIAGFCDREGLLMVSHGGPILEKLTEEKNFLSHLPFEIDATQKVEMETKLKCVYMEGEKNYKDADSFAIDFFSDVDFLGGVYVSTMLIAKHNSPVYLYEFAYDGSLNYLKKKMKIDREGACHGDDGGYLVKSKILKDPLSETDLLVKERLCTMWTNFAKFGNPTPKTDKSLPCIWEPIAETGLTYLKIDKDLTNKQELYPKRMKLFKELYESYNKS
ncbi:juvenile hormone esterase [Pieris rapae]|uniref:juvenile hormone esterase n=1 Tax=Pieris rapae TaxID=64459 RepID=UPI001E27C595|nr:juvenile hormone esterase [Pieris rapae]